MWHDPYIRDKTHSCVTWLIHMWHDSFICDMTHLYVICLMTHSNVTWLIHTWHDDSCHVHTPHFYNRCICVTWLIHMWHDSYKRDKTHSCVTWLIHMWHDSFIRDMITHAMSTRLILLQVYMYDMTHFYNRSIYQKGSLMTCTMGWLQWEAPYNYRSRLQNTVFFIGLFCIRDL